MRHARSILAFAAFLCLPLLAEEAPPAAPAAKTPAKKAATKKAPPAANTQAPGPGPSSIVISIDPESGQTRPATPEEINRLMKGRAPAAAVQPFVVTLPDGTEMMRLDERFYHFATVRLTPDGRVEPACVHGSGEAEAFAKGSAPGLRAEEK